LDGVERVVTPDDGVVVIERGVVHEFMRADQHGHTISDDAEVEEDVVVEEWTDPADGLKQVFFRNLLGVLEDTHYWGQGVWFGLQALLVCSRYDNYNVLVPGWGKGVATHAVYGLVEGVSWLTGLKAWYEEYTPVRLRAAAEGTMKKGV
jgi:hypothetical protein